MNIPALAPSDSERLFSTLSDIVFVLNAEGDILDLQVFGKELLRLELPTWKGQNLLSFTTFDSQDKVKRLLEQMQQGETGNWRHINLSTAAAQDIPLQVNCVASPDQPGTCWMFGRDLSAVSQMQQRLVDAHQSMERDYLRLRHMEARYRLLFETVSEPMMVVDVGQRRIMEANQAAQLLFKDAVRRLAGTDIAQCFEPSAKEALDQLLHATHKSGRMETARVRPVKATQDAQLHATVFVQEGGPLFLLRLQSMGVSPAVGVNALTSDWFKQALDNAPIGFVVADRSGAILASNAEFCSMAGVSSHGQLADRHLEDWLARGQVDMGVLLNNLRQSRTVRGFATELRSSVGVLMAVDVAAVTLTGDQPTYGFFFRDVQMGRGRADSLPGSGMVDSVAQLSQLVGRMPMKEIVGETSTMIERMCIQAALELTHNNRASAAEMLGLSRQSLYVKLHRYGMVSEGDSE